MPTGGSAEEAPPGGHGDCSATFREEGALRQILFEFPGTPFRIYGFGAMLVLALFGSTYLAAWRARRERMDPDVIYDLAFWLVVGGVIGARAFYVAQHREVIHQVWDIFAIWQGGIVLYGSILGGLVAGLIYRAGHPFPLRPMLDLAAPSVALGIALGRLGCFLNGCCYGDPCELPWAVSFPAETLPWADHVRRGLVSGSAIRSLPVHPTQFYSALDGFILVGLLSAFYPLRRRDGEVMALLMVSYPITRFLIERLRDDEGVMFAGLTISQGLSVLVLACGLAFWLLLSRLPPGRSADEAGPPAAG